MRRLRARPARTSSIRGCSRRWTAFAQPSAKFRGRRRQGRQRHRAVQARSVRPGRRSLRSAPRTREAANFLSVRRVRRIRADNTDGVGLVARHRTTTSASRWQAARAADGCGRCRARRARTPCSSASPAILAIANRTVDKALRLADTFVRTAEWLPRPCCAGMSYAELAGHHFDLVINATSTSLQGEVAAAARRRFRTLGHWPTT